MAICEISGRATFIYGTNSTNYVISTADAHTSENSFVVCFHAVEYLLQNIDSYRIHGTSKCCELPTCPPPPHSFLAHPLSFQTQV